MPTLAVGGTTIPYEIRRSARAKRMRIRILPGRVDVVAPALVMRRTVEAFVRSKADWIHDKTQALREQTWAAVPESFVSGTKIRFRGEALDLQITTADCRRGTLRVENAFLVTVPRGLTEEERETSARKLVTAWLTHRAREDTRGWVEKYSAILGVYPTKIRIGNQQTLWGSCSVRGVISLNRKLLAAPREIFEYVVVHELCHLIERNHSPRFWSRVESLLPDYRERRSWLKRMGVALG